MNRSYFVYILASRSRSLYTGVTNNLTRRVFEHGQGWVHGFADRYQIHRLVYFEVFSDVRNAIAREKHIKAWRRAKKVALIEADNPTWDDLAAVSYASRGHEKQIPRPPNQARDDMGKG